MNWKEEEEKEREVCVDEHMCVHAKYIVRLYSFGKKEGGKPGKSATTTHIGSLSLLHTHS